MQVEIDGKRYQTTGDVRLVMNPWGVHGIQRALAPEGGGPVVWQYRDVIQADEAAKDTIGEPGAAQEEEGQS